MRSLIILIHILKQNLKLKNYKNIQKGNSCWSVLNLIYFNLIGDYIFEC